MTFKETLRTELIKAYIENYGADRWNNMTEEERTETLGQLLGSFLTVAKRR